MEAPRLAPMGSPSRHTSRRALAPRRPNSSSSAPLACFTVPTRGAPSTSLTILCTLATLVLLCVVLPSRSVQARNFTLRDSVQGKDFFDYFWWWDYDDPTHGTVDFLSKGDAMARNLSYLDSQGRFVLRADDTTVLDARSNQGRASVRLHSYRKMMDGVLVAKMTHMPVGCGTWPAFWTCTNQRWPVGGEIDILEGANDQGPRNQISLHTQAGCTIPQGNTSRSSGTSYASDCAYQPGCSQVSSVENSFGSGLNRNGGGWFAMVRDTAVGGEGISVYFWPATTPTSSLPAVVGAAAPAATDAPSSSSLPPFVLTGANASDSDREAWGLPMAHFPNDAGACPMNRLYGAHELIFDLTLCGDWAGSTFAYAPNCPRNITCSEHVRTNASAFRDARFEVEYLRVYTDPADGAAASSSRAPWLPSAWVAGLAAVALAVSALGGDELVAVSGLGQLVV